MSPLLPSQTAGSQEPPTPPPLSPEVPPVPDVDLPPWQPPFLPPSLPPFPPPPPVVRIISELYATISGATGFFPPIVYFLPAGFHYEMPFGMLLIHGLNVTLFSEGEGATLDSMHLNRAFDVAHGGHLQLRGINILSGGNVKEGGGILVRDGGVLTMSNSTIRDSLATSGERFTDLASIFSTEGEVSHQSWKTKVRGGGIAVVETSELVKISRRWPEGDTRTNETGGTGRDSNNIMATSAACHCFATGHADGTISIVDALTMEMVSQRQQEHIGGVNCLDFDPTGTYLVSGGADGLRVWRVRPALELIVNVSHIDVGTMTNSPHPTAANPDNNYLPEYGPSEARFRNVPLNFTSARFMRYSDEAEDEYASYSYDFGYEVEGDPRTCGAGEKTYVALVTAGTPIGNPSVIDRGGVDATSDHIVYGSALQLWGDLCSLNQGNIHLLANHNDLFITVPEYGDLTEEEVERPFSITAMNVLFADSTHFLLIAGHDNEHTPSLAGVQILMCGANNQRRCIKDATLNVYMYNAFVQPGIIHTLDVDMATRTLSLEVGRQYLKVTRWMGPAMMGPAIDDTLYRTTSEIYCASLSPNGRRVVLARSKESKLSTSAVIEILDVANLRVVKSSEVADAHRSMLCAFTEDESRVFTNDAGPVGGFNLWDARGVGESSVASRQVDDVLGPSTYTYYGYDDPYDIQLLVRLSFSLDGRYIRTWDSLAAAVTWDSRTLEFVAYEESVFKPRPPPLSPPAAPSPPPQPRNPDGALTVVTGPCTVHWNSDSSGCVRSDGYPQNSYSAGETCLFGGLPSLPITVTFFAVENSQACEWDHLLLDGVKYCGTTGPQGVVPLSGMMEWVADDFINRQGFELCFGLLIQPPPPAPPPPPASPPPLQYEFAPASESTTAFFGSRRKANLESDSLLGIVIREDGIRVGFVELPFPGDQLKAVVWSPT